jgi:hypothetical protein
LHHLRLRHVGYFGGLSVFSEIFQSLLALYGHPHVVAELTHTGPRRRNAATPAEAEAAA